MKEHITTGGKTLCWTCRKAYGKCSWTEVDYTKKGWPIRFEPVKGWNAIPTKNEKYTSFLVGIAFHPFTGSKRIGQPFFV